MITEPRIFDNIDTSAFPLPTVIETLDYEQLFKDRVLAFRQRDPNYDLLLESDPAAKVMEASAYCELLIRQRMNYAAQQTLMAFATGDALDRVIGDFWSVKRQVITPGNDEVFPPIAPVYETDEQFRYRLQVRAGASSGAGSVEHYKFHALSAHPHVRDVTVYSPNHYPYYNTGGLVCIAVLSSEGNLIPTQEVLDAVDEKVHDKAIKMLTDIVQVEAANLRTINVTAEVYLLPKTPLSVFTALEQTLRDAVTAKQALGWDITRSWIVSQLQIGGVHSIELTNPTQNLQVAPNEFASIGTITLIFKGFSDFEADEISEMEKRRLRRLMYDDYVSFAITYRRTASDIAADLVYKDKIGVIQPTVTGLFKHLQLDVLYTVTSVDALSEESLASVIWYHLASTNGYLPAGTSQTIQLT